MRGVVVPVDGGAGRDDRVVVGDRRVEVLVGRAVVVRIGVEDVPDLEVEVRQADCIRERVVDLLQAARPAAVRRRAALVREIIGLPDVRREGAPVAQVVAERHGRLPDGIPVADRAAPHVVAQDVQRHLDGEGKVVLLLQARHFLLRLGFGTVGVDRQCRSDKGEGHEAARCFHHVHGRVPLVGLKPLLADADSLAEVVPKRGGESVEGRTARHDGFLLTISVIARERSFMLCP